jgi:excisionase family DNA binding protein
VAAYLGVSRAYVYKLVDERKLRAHKFGRALRISRDEVASYEREALTS